MSDEICQHLQAKYQNPSKSTIDQFVNQTLVMDVCNLYTAFPPSEIDDKIDVWIYIWISLGATLTLISSFIFIKCSIYHSKGGERTSNTVKKITPSSIRMNTMPSYKNETKDGASPSGNYELTRTMAQSFR